MPFGFWVLGNGGGAIVICGRCTGLKCLSAFGFWGTLDEQVGSSGRQTNRLKCLSAFGFWGTLTSKQQSMCPSTSLKCLSAFGFWGTHGIARSIGANLSLSQMPFGFWVLGNDEAEVRRVVERIVVSNAFRLLGSGEQKFRW